MTAKVDNYRAAGTKRIINYLGLLVSRQTSISLCPLAMKRSSLATTIVDSVGLKAEYKGVALTN